MHGRDHSTLLQLAYVEGAAEATEHMVVFSGTVTIQSLVQVMDPFRSAAERSSAFRLV